MSYIKNTEKDSKYNHLEKMDVLSILQNINQEDRAVPIKVAEAIPEIEKFVLAVVGKMEKGGRLFYIGAGTSGRLGILDASECPPTFGVPDDWVIGLIAGGDSAIRKAVEKAEDSKNQAWKDLSAYLINDKDVVLGIAASGTTPYVVNGLAECQKNNILTGCITSNPGAPITEVADYPIVIDTGAEFVTGSTRMKAGTAQKLVLNMISTSVMIQLGRVVDNKMVDMQLTNQKLVERGTLMIVNATGMPKHEAQQALLEQGSVRAVLELFKNK